MIDNVTLKKATIKDLEDIQELNKKLFVREFEKYNKLLNIEWTFGEKGTKYFKELIQDDFVYIAEINNIIIGYLTGCIHDSNECFTERFAESAWNENIEAINFYKNSNFEDYEKTLICKLKEE